MYERISKIRWLSEDVCVGVCLFEWVSLCVFCTCMCVFICVCVFAGACVWTKRKNLNERYQGRSQQRTFLVSAATGFFEKIYWRRPSEHKGPRLTCFASETKGPRPDEKWGTFFGGKDNKGHKSREKGEKIKNKTFSFVDMTWTLSETI